MHNYWFFYYSYLPSPSPLPNTPNYIPPPLIYNVSNYDPNAHNNVVGTLEPIRTTADRQSPHQAIDPPNRLPHSLPPPDHSPPQLGAQSLQRNGVVVDRNVYKYPKKNAQSNLTNQIFSYLSIPAKSMEVVLRLFSGSEEKARVFYLWMGEVKRHNKKYINRRYIRDLMAFKHSHIMDGILQKTKIESAFSQQELRSVIRRLVFHYLTHTCTLTLLTSSKLDRYSLHEHLTRRREVLHYLKHTLHHT